MLLAVGGQGAEEVHALRQIGYVNIRLRCLHHTLPVEGVDLHLGKLVSCMDVQDNQKTLPCFPRSLPL